MDYKEYSKLRSIARKRIERAAAAGLAPYVYIPTVKEVRASDNPEQFMYNVRRFLETGKTVEIVPLRIYLRVVTITKRAIT